MFGFHPRFALWLSLTAALTVAGCGDSKPTPNPKPGADGKTPPTKTDTAASGTPAAATGGESGEPAGTSTGTPFEDPADFDTGELPILTGSGSGGDESGTGAPDATATGHPGPCKVKWSSGTIAKFTYEGDTAGTVEIDAEGDGKPDVCGTFALTDGKPTSVKIDEKCDDSVDLEITTKFAADQNVATATATDKNTGKKTSLTMVTLPAFTGVMPGYPMQSAKRKIGLTARDGLIRTANVKAPSTGPKLRASFYYSAAHGIKAIKEDFDADGTVDQRYDYRYDDEGNITRITLTTTAGEAKTRTIGKLDYSCWK